MSIVINSNNETSTTFSIKRSALIDVETSSNHNGESPIECKQLRCTLEYEGNEICIFIKSNEIVGEFMREEKEDDNIESTTLPDILVEENTLKNINRNLTEDDVENIDGFGRFYNILQNSRRRYQIKKSTFKKLSILAI
ncbi:12257_t:CDS:2 [Entrophospora sp. SA101]|nr:12257_t:CDS:2 [Entrophospora sp. SA101]